MKVKTYLIYILDSKLAYDDEQMKHLQDELDKHIGDRKTALTINPPINDNLKDVVGIWALAENETENEVIADQVENILKEKGLHYQKEVQYTFLDGEIWYKELK